MFWGTKVTLSCRLKPLEASVAHVCVRMYVCIYIYMCIYIYVYIYIYIYIYIYEKHVKLPVCVSIFSVFQTVFGVLQIMQIPNIGIASKKLSVSIWNARVIVEENYVYCLF